MDGKDTTDGASLPTMDNTERFKMSDHQLLTSGFFADCELVLGEKVWKLHKSVVCLRSKYFERALMGNWPVSASDPAEAADSLTLSKEARTSKITLMPGQFAEEQIDWLINFIYTGACDLDELRSTKTVLQASAHLFALGDYFLVPGLCDCAIDTVMSRWDPRYRQRMGRQLPWLRMGSSIRNWTYEFDGEDWQQAMRCVYKQWAEDDKNLLKIAMMKLSTEKLYCRQELLTSKYFLSFIDEEPRFARDFMKVMVADHITKLQT
ncbi:hypothetical protein ACHAQA_007993 [Verticillium albo-atrum]